jgi:rhomboid protease GluP
LIGGIALGWILGYDDRRRENRWDRGLAVFLTGITVLLLALPVIRGFFLVFF